MKKQHHLHSMPVLEVHGQIRRHVAASELLIKVTASLKGTGIPKKAFIFINFVTSLPQ